MLPVALTMNSSSGALVALGRALAAAGYRFVTVTPETHRRVLARRPPSTRTLRDVFGWSLPFVRGLAVPDAMVDLLRDAGALLEGEGGLRSAVRFSSLGEHLFVHSAYPTQEADSVFFGPDTYRFCAMIARAAVRARRVVDIGCGSGAGGIVAKLRSDHVVLADVNERALHFARVNAELAGVEGAEIVRSDVLAQVEGAVDLVVANPPYLRDDLARTYRDGGGALGEGLSVRIAREALARLDPGGTLLLYTATAIVDGDDLLFRAIEPILARRAAKYRYDELDPDVFGEELERPAYAGVERIAVVSLVATVS